MLPRSVSFALWLTLASPTLCPFSIAQQPPAQKNTSKAAPAKPANEVAKPAALSAQEQVYERTKTTLTKFLQDIQNTEKLMSGKLVGGERGELGPAFIPVTEKDISEAFNGPLEDIRKELASLEASHREALQKNDQDCSYCGQAYDAAIARAISDQEQADQGWLNLAIPVLRGRAGRSQERLDDERGQLTKTLDQNPNLSSEQRQAALAELDRNQSEVRKKLFDQLALEFRGYMGQLSEQRKNYIRESWCWNEFASQLAESSKTTESTRAAQLAKEVLQRYGPDHPLGVGGQLILDYGTYDWCKDRRYPDIQRADACDVFQTDVMKQPSVASLRPKSCPGAAPIPKPLEEKGSGEASDLDVIFGTSRPDKPSQSAPRVPE